MVAGLALTKTLYPELLVLEFFYEHGHSNGTWILFELKDILPFWVRMVLQFSSSVVQK